MSKSILQWLYAGLIGAAAAAVHFLQGAFTPDAAPSTGDVTIDGVLLVAVGAIARVLGWLLGKLPKPA